MLSKELLQQVKLIEITSKKAVDELLSGSFKSHFKGQGVQFSEHRVYVPGDDVRHLDWKVSARTRDPLIKKFEEERELNVFLVVDISKSQDFGSKARVKSEMLAEVGAMLTLAALRTGDQVGALFFAGKVEKIVPPKKGRGHLQRLIVDLLTVRADSLGTNLEEALMTANRLMRHRGIIFILSDFMSQGYENALKQVCNRHDVVAFVVEDPGEFSVIPVGKVPVFNPETLEEGWVDTHSYGFQAWLKEMSQAHLAELSGLCRKSRVEMLHVKNDEDYKSQVVRFLRARALRKGR